MSAFECVKFPAKGRQERQADILVFILVIIEYPVLVNQDGSCEQELNPRFPVPDIGTVGKGPVGKSNFIIDFNVVRDRVLRVPVEADDERRERRDPGPAQRVHRPRRALDVSDAWGSSC